MPASLIGAGVSARFRFTAVKKCCSGALLLGVLSAACSSHTPQKPSTGMAYAGPANLPLRNEIGSKASVIATVHHGEKLAVVDTRRRFIKVRTENGVEGWTDSNLLLNQQQMDDLRQLADSAAKLPSQGAATAFDLLNIHTEPARQSPSFFQIPEGGAVEVIGHKLAPRNAPPPAPAAVVHKPAPANAKKKSQGRNVIEAPPMPVPPKPPANWMQLSRPRVSDLANAPKSSAAPVPPAAAAQASLDDWSLVRMRDGKVGWVLSRMLSMAIPDEVAQHAEGHRITAYVPLDDVRDKSRNETKHNWLWTTVSSGGHSYEFDSFRVFVWSTRHHRYETAFIERNVKGYYPIEAREIPGQDGKAFSLVVEAKDGKLYKNTYAFSGYHVRLMSKEPYQQPPPLPEVRTSGRFDPPAPQAQAETSWWRDLRKRVFGGN